MKVSVNGSEAAMTHTGAIVTCYVRWSGAWELRKELVTDAGRVPVRVKQLMTADDFRVEKVYFCW